MRVLSDLVIQDSAMTDAEFAAMVANPKPVGYGRFQRLIPGDYSYSKAIVGLFVQTPATGNRPALMTATLNVDAPDIVDRGSVTLTAVKTWVPFKRTFNCPVDKIEVACSFKSGAVNSTPQVLTADVHIDGFWVSLISNADNTTLAAGTITWQALGY